jgi:pimeloyl-ACP methyl ester carboxylesterase
VTPNRSLLAVVVCLSVTAAACSAGPSSRPDVAVEQNSPGLPADSEDPDGEELRELEVPSTDLAWNDCTQTTLDSFGLTSRTPGLILECTAFEAPVDASGEMFGSFTVGVMRAKLNTTPDDAAPLVFTSGADRASIEMLADITSGQSSTLLAAHPIVAIDRRGIGRSSAVNCVTSDSRIPLSDLGQFASSDGDAVDRAVDAGRTATIECTDLLQPQELAFGVSYAADDLEELRLNWGVETLGIIGSGNGASIALAYAARYPDRVARMILDSPTDVTADQLRKAEHRTQGREAAFAAFTQRCIALECSLGPDPRTAVTDLIEAAGRYRLRVGVLSDRPVAARPRPVRHPERGARRRLLRTRRPDHTRGGSVRDRRPVRCTLHRRQAVADAAGGAGRSAGLVGAVPGIRHRRRPRSVGVFVLADRTRAALAIRPDRSSALVQRRRRSSRRERWVRCHDRPDRGDRYPFGGNDVAGIRPSGTRWISVRTSRGSGLLGNGLAATGRQRVPSLSGHLPGCAPRNPRGCLGHRGPPLKVACCTCHLASSSHATVDPPQK